MGGLSRDLSSRSIKSKLAAANCCCNLALSNSKTRITLCKFVAPYLIVNLENTNQHLIVSKFDILYFFLS
jgi:hypothetical protein